MLTLLQPKLGNVIVLYLWRTSVDKTQGSAPGKALPQVTLQHKHPKMAANILICVFAFCIQTIFIAFHGVFLLLGLPLAPLFNQSHWEIFKKINFKQQHQLSKCHCPFFTCKVKSRLLIQGFRSCKNGPRWLTLHSPEPSTQAKGPSACLIISPHATRCSLVANCLSTPLSGHPLLALPFCLLSP